MQSHAVAALVNFSEECPKSIFVTYLEPLMNQLEKVLNTKFNEVGEWVVGWGCDLIGACLGRGFGNWMGDWMDDWVV